MLTFTLLRFKVFLKSIFFTADFLSSRVFCALSISTLVIQLQTSFQWFRAAVHGLCAGVFTQQPNTCSLTPRLTKKQLSLFVQSLQINSAGPAAGSCVPPQQAFTKRLKIKAQLVPQLDICSDMQEKLKFRRRCSAEYLWISLVTKWVDVYRLENTFLPFSNKMAPLQRVLTRGPT